MDRSNRVAQLYGYTVCLVAVIVVLFATPQVVDNLFTYADPLAAPRTDFSDGTVANSSLTSFEAYRATQPRRTARPGVTHPPTGQTGQAEPTGAAGAVSADSMSDAELHTRYEALRGDRIVRVRFHAAQSLVTHVILLIAAGLLFAAHWRWLRRMPRAGDSAAPA